MLKAQRAIIEQLIKRAFVKGAMLNVANLVLSGAALTDRQQEAFQLGIAKWFYVDCDECGKLMPTEDVPSAISSGNLLCRKCRQR